MSDYRWFDNLDSASPGMPLAATATAATAPAQGTKFRLRVSVHAATYALALSGMDLKLQFAQKSGTCDTSYTGETYADVATASGVIRFADNASVADGATALSTSTDPTHDGDTIVMQTYEEENPFTNSVNVVPVGQDALWDFALVDFSAPASTAYCFRIVENDDTVIGTPTMVPEITTDVGGTPAVNQIHYRWRYDDGGQTTASFVTSEDGPITTATSALNVYKGDRRRLRFVMSNEGTASATGYTYRLEYASSSCTAWSQVPTSANLANEEWVMDLSQYILDGAVTTAQLSVPPGKSFVAGGAHVQANSSSAHTLTSSQYSEFEYGIRSTNNAQTGLLYCFRLTNAGSITNFTYTKQPQVTLSGSTRPTSGGSGLESFGTSTARGGGTRGGGGGLEGGGGSGPVGGGSKGGGGGLE
jgi:hypothetical protein